MSLGVKIRPLPLTARGPYHSAALPCCLW